MQINEVNLHHVKELMDEIFGKDNFVGIISFQKTGGIEAELLPSTVDYLVWYAKNIQKVKYHQLYLDREVGDTSLDRYDTLLLPDGTTRRLNKHELETGEISPGSRRYQLFPLYSDGASSEPQEFVFHGKSYVPRSGTHWKTSVKGLERLAEAGRIEEMGRVIRYRRFADDIPMIPVSDRWESTQIGTKRIYVVQTSPTVIQRCILMTTDPGDLVFDPTCGSGTSAFVAEQWGRRWITCDTSRVAVTLAKQRLMTSVFEYYELAHPNEGVSGGFRYTKIPHVTLRSIAKAQPPEEEDLYDKPHVDRSKRRVTGPFTIEAVPSQGVRNFDEVKSAPPLRTIINPDDTITMVNVIGGGDEPSGLLSTVNRTVAAAVVRICRELVRITRNKSILVMTVYGSQRDVIEEMLFQSGLSNIPVATTSGGVGIQADIVVVALARNNSEFYMGKEGDLPELNVAISRAKEKLIIVGNIEMLRNGLATLPTATRSAWRSPSRELGWLLDHRYGRVVDAPLEVTVC